MAASYVASGAGIVGGLPPVSCGGKVVGYRLFFNRSWITHEISWLSKYLGVLSTVLQNDLDSSL
jgi:hypothetical protein